MNYRRKRRLKKALHISHEDLKKHVEEYLARGGKITRLEYPKRTTQEIKECSARIFSTYDADNFLMGIA